MSSRLSCRTGRRSDSWLPPSLSRVTPSAVSEHFSELLGCPISRSLTTSCVCLELRPLPSPGITRLRRYCEPLRHPSTPRPSLTGVRLIIPDHALGFPVLRALSLCTCCRHYPGAAEGRIPRSYSPIRISLPRKGCRVGLHIGIFEACSAFTHVAARTLARSPIRDPLPEGFRHFVTSMPAPVASGWSGCRVGLAPTGKRRLVTAHTLKSHSWPTPVYGRAVQGADIRAGFRHTPIAGSRQLVEQRLCLFEILCVETLGEPAVDRCEQAARLGALALVAPPPPEARRGAPYLGFGRHLPRQRERVAKIGFGQFLLSLLAVDVTAQPQRLGTPEPLVGIDGQRFLERPQAFGQRAAKRLRVGQQGQEHWDPKEIAVCAVGSQCFANEARSFLEMIQLRLRPTMGYPGPPAD